MKIQLNEQTQWQTQNKSDIQVRIVARKKRILDDDVVISANNIQRIGEIIAISVTKTVMCRSGRNLYWLYNGLIQDCKRSNDVKIVSQQAHATVEKYKLRDKNKTIVPLDIV